MIYYSFDDNIFYNIINWEYLYYKKTKKMEAIMKN